MAINIANVRAAIAGAPAEATAAEVLSSSYLRAFSLSDLGNKVKSLQADFTTDSTSHHLSLGKAVAILAEQKPEEVKTLSKFVAKIVGVKLESATYRCANVFGEMVGDGHGTIMEADFDACRLNWLKTTSSILGVLAKSESADTDAAAIREEVAKALRARTEKTGEVLQTILDTIKPEKEGKGDGEKEDGEKGEGEKPDLVPLDLLSPEALKLIRDAIMACSDVAKLKLAEAGFGALAIVAGEQLAAAAPQTAAA